MTRFLRAAWLVDAQGPAHRGPQPRDPLHDAVLRGRRACWCSRSGSSRKGGRSKARAAGILWIAIAFSGTLALGRTFERERQSETLRALLLAPVDRPALYVGKLAGVAAAARGGRSRDRAAGGADVPGARCSRTRADARRCWPPARSGSPRSGRCLPRCSSARAAATSCCRSCCIRSRFRSSSRACAARRRCCRPKSICRWRASWLSMLVFFDAGFVTLALWTFEPVMTE